MTTKEEREKLIDLAGRIPALPYVHIGSFQGPYEHNIEASDGSLICRMDTVTYMMLATNMAPALAREVEGLEAKEAEWGGFLREKLGTSDVVYFVVRWREMEQEIRNLRAEVEQARKYVAALIKKMSPEEFCALVEAGEVDGIRAWMEVEG